MKDLTAFVLGGGGHLGAHEVGMLSALVDSGIEPDLIIGTSIGAVNGAVFASDPSKAGVEKLAHLWTGLQASDVLSGSMFAKVKTLARTRIHVGDDRLLRTLLGEVLPVARVEDLAVTFECVAASIELATVHYFSKGPLVDAIMASAAVPGLLPPVEIDNVHYLDGGLVASIPLDRAIDLGCVDDLRAAGRPYRSAVGRTVQPLGGRDGGLRDFPASSILRGVAISSCGTRRSCAAHRRSEVVQRSPPVPHRRRRYCRATYCPVSPGVARLPRRPSAVKLPPRGVRRLVLWPLPVLAVVLYVTTVPLLVIGALIVSYHLPGKWRAFRVLGLATCYLFVEAAVTVAALATWVISGLGWKQSSPRFVTIHYAFLRWALRVLVLATTRLFSLEIEAPPGRPTVVGDEEAGPSGAPLIVLSRHAGPADSLLLLDEVMSWEGRRPRIVAYDALQLDPALDILLNRTESFHLAQSTSWRRYGAGHRRIGVGDDE